MYMFKYILKRLGLMLMCFSIIMLMCFILVKLLPFTVTAGVGEDKTKLYFKLVDRGYIENLVYDAKGNVIGYDKVPILRQLWLYLTRIFKSGDFGIGVKMASYRNKPVVDVFIKHLPPTILINIYSSLIGVPIGLALGILAALKKNKWQDHFISTGV